MTKRIIFAFFSVLCFFAVLTLWDETPIDFTFDTQTRVVSFLPGNAVSIREIELKDAYGILSPAGSNSVQIAPTNAVARIYVHYSDYRGGKRCREFYVSAADNIVVSDGGEGFPVTLPKNG